MVVCRFFQQGYCRYGQNCRFEHIYGSKFTYHANQSQTQQVAPTAQTTGCTDEQLVNQVQADMQSALRGGQWILSCYAPYKEKPIFPGIKDMSPEEARLLIYEAKNNNNLEQAVTFMNNLFKDARQKYEQLLQPNIEIIKVLRSLYKGEIVNSPFSNGAQNTFSGTGNTASSIFRGAVQNSQPVLPQNTNTAASIFNQGQNSIFNPQPDQAKQLFSQANNTSIFNQNSTPMTGFETANQNGSIAKSIFSSAVQNTANQFNTGQQNPSSIFSAANQNIFGPQPTENSSPFSQNQNSPFTQGQNTSPFAQSQNNGPFSQGQNTSPFSPGSIFGVANSQVSTTNDPGVYSKPEELTEVDLEAFRSDHFELGFIPEVPPPQQLCS